MTRVRKFSVLSLAKLHALVGGFLGLLAGIIYSFGGLMIDTLVTLEWMTTNETPGLSYGTVLAFGALIGMPLIFAFVGFVVGIIVAIVFNLVSKWVDGVEIDIQ